MISLRTNIARSTPCLRIRGAVSIPAFTQFLLFIIAEKGVLYGLVGQLPKVFLTKAEGLRGSSVLLRQRGVKHAAVIGTENHRMACAATKSTEIDL